MADQPVKKVRKPRKQKVKQGHKLVWLTLAIILIPLAILGYILLTSASNSSAPVVGDRYTSSDLNPKITEQDIENLQGQLMGLEGVESATINLKAATLRIHLNMVDGTDEETMTYTADTAYNIVNDLLPVDTYFTNSADGKNYDLEIDVYNYIVDDVHPAEGQIYLKVTKTGAGQKVVDYLTTPKNPDLAQSVKERPTVEEPMPEEETAPEGEEYYDEGE